MVGCDFGVGQHTLAPRNPDLSGVTKMLRAFPGRVARRADRTWYVAARLESLEVIVKRLVRCLAAIGIVSVSGCGASAGEGGSADTQQALTGADVIRVATLADQGLAEFQNAYLPGNITNDRGIRFGSLGSDVFRAHGDQGNTFWMLTDRGPNGQPGGRRTFAVPEFAPSILRVKVRGDAIDVVEVHPVAALDGTLLRGLPNLATDEVAFNFDATQPLGINPNGIDPEAIVRLPAGDFWLVEEYRPSLLHLDSTGHVLERLVPLNAGLTGTSYPVTEALPEILKTRRANRGFEGLSLSPDKTTMVAAMQSPLEHPTRNIGRASRNLRFLSIDVASRQTTGEFVYQMEEVCSFLGLTTGCGVAPGDMKVSGLAALTNDQILVLERTDDVAKLYLVDLSAATNILGSAFDLAATTPAIEELVDPATAGVLVLPKTLVVDLSTLPGIPKKIEGVTVINPETLAISNDNDFGLVDETTYDAAGNLTNDTGVKSQIRYLRLPAALPH